MDWSQSRAYSQACLYDLAFTVKDDDGLACFLAITSYLSDVFDEVNGPLTARAHAVNILFVKQNQGSAGEIFDEHLLTAWLNFANGAFDLDTPVDTDGDDVAGLF